MKRVSKNLTKAVTLSVLLMLPYGMAEAKEYDRPIGGKYDNYAMTLKPGGGSREPIATSDGQRTTYDFGEDETTLNITIDKFKVNYGIEISSGSGAIRDREIFIANKLNIILTRDEEKPTENGDGISFSTNSFDNLINIIYNERLEGIPRILETPYVTKDDNSKDKVYPPYKYEIEMIRNKEFDGNLINKIRS